MAGDPQGRLSSVTPPLFARLAAMTTAQRAAFTAQLADDDLAVLEEALAEAEAERAAASELAEMERAAKEPWWKHRLGWLKRARRDQLAPDGDWDVWFFCGGRGSGKTLSGAEDASEFCRQHDRARMALVGPTFADVRDTMVEGETGLLAVLPPSSLRGGSIATAWNRSLGELFLSNGAKLKAFSSEQPGRLRGPQHHRVWADEPAEFADAHLPPVPLNPGEDRTWANVVFGCRLGDAPQIVVTGTPKPVKLVKHLLQTAIVTSATTYDNLDNLSPVYRRIIAQYEGTRLGRQELMAEMLEDVEGALWKREWIESTRVRDMPECSRVVVAVDPSGSRRGSEVGIVVVGRGLRDEHGYVLADRSLHGSAHEWAMAAVGAYREFKADRIVAERNFGGDMVETTLRAVDSSVPYSDVVASRGKTARAEPIAALYERRLVHHVGVLDELEDQQCSWLPGMPSPDRMDAAVWGVWALSIGFDIGRPAPKVATNGDRSLTGDLLEVGF